MLGLPFPTDDFEMLCCKPNGSEGVNWSHLYRFGHIFGWQQNYSRANIPSQYWPTNHPEVTNQLRQAKGREYSNSHLHPTKTNHFQVKTAPKQSCTKIPKDNSEKEDQKFPLAISCAMQIREFEGNGKVQSYKFVRVNRKDGLCLKKHSSWSYSREYSRSSLL